MSEPIFFAPLRVPLVDVRTGLMSREWYLFFQAMFLRVGGTSAPSNDDLQLLTDLEDATDDGLDIKTYVADLERAIASIDEPPSTVSADIAELQMLVASIPEDAGGIRGAPSAKVGLTAVPGSAFTVMPSDAAPALDQSITPNMTGAWIFSKGTAVAPPAFGQTVSLSAASGGIAATFYGPTTGAAGFNVNFYDTTNAALRGFIGFGTSTVTGAAVTDLGIAPGAGGSVVVGTANGGAKGTQFGPTGDVTFNFKTGFNATAPIAKPTVTGSRAANAALASLLTALANYGLVTDSSTV